MIIDFQTALNDALQVEARRRKTSVAKLSKKAVAQITATVNTEYTAVAAALNEVCPDNKAATGPRIYGSVNQPLPNNEPVVLKKAASPKLSKKDLAANVFAEMAGPGVPRKDVIAAIMGVADLSKAGAATYYQNFSSGHWEVL